MKLQISDFRFQIGAWLMCLLLSAAPGAEVLDRVLAVVAGDLILMSDIRVARDFGFMTVGGADPDGQALARLIDRALILAEVERFAPPEEEIGRYYREHSELFTRNGVLLPFENVRPEVVRALTTQNRDTLVQDWLAGLRRRADVRMGNRQ